jgi:oxygen-dependent protoporphyrinogen oxidase
MCQPEVGHLARTARIRARSAAIPGLHLVGNGYEGVGIPDLAEQAERIAAC